ncbi:MAG: phosphoribosyltransferase family protein [Thermoproteus sp.]
MATIKDETITRLQAVYLIRALLHELKLKDLAEILEIDKTVLSKYSNFYFLPNYNKSKYIINKLTSTKIVQDILNSYIKILVNKSMLEYPDIHYLLSINNDLVLFYILNLSRKLIDTPVDRIITVEGGGLYVASILSSILRTEISYAIRDKYIPSSYVEYIRPESKMYSGYIALPNYSVRKGERVLIVDDIIITGDTIITLYRILRKIKNIYITSLASLIAISERVAKNIESETGFKLTCEICG